MNKSLKIAIAGLGNVGKGVVEILTLKAELLTRRTGRKIIISAVSARNKNIDRGINLNGIKWLDNPVSLADDKDTDIIVEVIGGADGIAYELCKKALSNKKHVVTANKAMISKHGLELATLAEQNNVTLTFEAAIAGGIPVIKTLREGLAANNLNKVSGILNGTCNYILTEMKKGKRPFDEVLKEAQKLGYAEADPSFDVDGIDAAHKLSILSAITHNCPVNFSSVYIEGIKSISLSDIQYAEELGYTIRLLGISELSNGLIEQRVHPCLVPKDSKIAEVNGALNAVLIECDSAGPMFLMGAGAGGGPTASAVVADIIDIACGRITHPFGALIANLIDGKFGDIMNHRGEYYVRLLVKDQQGVLASITSLLSNENIGVETILQKADARNMTAQIALITHETGEKNIRKALGDIGKMDYVIEPPHMIRIER